MLNKYYQWFQWKEQPSFFCFNRLEKGGVLTLLWDCERLVLGRVSYLRCKVSARSFQVLPGPSPLAATPQTPRPHPCLLTGSHRPFCSLLHFLLSCFPLSVLQSESSHLKVKVAHSRPTLWPHGLYSPWNSPGQNTAVGSLSLLQGIFPSQGSNPGLWHWRLILYKLSHKGSPNIYLESINTSFEGKAHFPCMIAKSVFYVIWHRIIGSCFHCVLS